MIGPLVHLKYKQLFFMTSILLSWQWISVAGFLLAEGYH